MMSTTLRFIVTQRFIAVLQTIALAHFFAYSVSYAGILKSELVISTGLSLPVYAAAPEGDLNHLYVAEERAGRITRMNLATKALTVMLDLPDVVEGVETGLNGFAFHPDYAANGKIYLNVSGDGSDNIRILEYTRSTSNPNQFDPSSRREILNVPNPSISHNGGWIGFSPIDGYLYLGMGDGGNVGTTATKGIEAQNVNHLWGKMLRIDVDGDDFPDDSNRNYASPNTNPFAEGGGAPEVFAYGLRHPFRNSFDRETGDLYIGDVGSRFFEEINFLPAGTEGGQNYGWRPREGYVDNPDWGDPLPPNAIDPIHVFDHGPAAAVIGGYVYRGDAIPWLEGTYFYTDFVQKIFRSFVYDNGSVTEFTDRALELASPLGSYAGIASFAQDAAGELYMLDLNRGDIYKITARTSTEAGDYNQDGIVNSADYTIWRDTFGSAVASGTGADGNGNGTVDSGDYTIWKSFFGRSVGGSGSSSVSGGVPEPAILGMVAVAIAISMVPFRFRRPDLTLP